MTAPAVAPERAEDRSSAAKAAAVGPKIVRIVVLVLLAAAPLVVLETLRPPQYTLMWRALFDAGHAPLFGVLSLALLALSLTILDQTRTRHYGLAFALTSVANLASEALQFHGPRNADPADFVRGLVGSAAFLLLVASFDGRLPVFGVRGRRVAARILAAALLAGTLVPVARIEAAYKERDAAFPRIADFGAGWERHFVRPRFSGIERLQPPVAWPRDADDVAARVTFFPERRSGLFFRELPPDWTRHASLAFDVFSELDAPVDLRLHLDDTSHHAEAARREARTEPLYAQIRIEPGSNRIRLPLLGKNGLATNAGLDLEQMCHMLLVAERSERASFSLWIDDVRLE